MDITIEMLEKASQIVIDGKVVKARGLEPGMEVMVLPRDHRYELVLARRILLDRMGKAAHEPLESLALAAQAVAALTAEISR